MKTFKEFIRESTHLIELSKNTLLRYARASNKLDAHYDRVHDNNFGSGDYRRAKEEGPEAMKNFSTDREHLLKRQAKRRRGFNLATKKLAKKPGYTGVEAYH